MQGPKPKTDESAGTNYTFKPIYNDKYYINTHEKNIYFNTFTVV